MGGLPALLRVDFFKRPSPHTQLALPSSRHETFLAKENIR